MAAPDIYPGRSFPIGATVVPEMVNANGGNANGVNFCLYSKRATGVELLLFDRADDALPARTIRLDPDANRSYHYWHAHVPGIGSGQLYGYRVHGPNNPAAGLRFDPQKLLVDPYALAVANTENYQRSAAIGPGDNSAVALKSVVVDPCLYDWEGDMPFERPFADSVIYEMHVAGFTRHPNSGVAANKRGTYAGLIEKIPYLVDLGVKAVELMPVQQFDAQAAPNGVNYWGYQPIAWFAPHRAYSSNTDPLGPVNEFRDLVKALHRAGIEVILDVVFNHTAEEGADGPTLCYRGIDNPTYYLLDSANPARYIDVTGCGNTTAGNRTVLRRMILDSLRHWVEHMHVDGFRFDLASSLTRGENGDPLPHPPILLDIEADPVLAGTKIIAEPWDAAGLYQVSNFVGDRWAVWNGAYRDTVRKFVKSDVGTVGKLADCLVGSRSLFEQPGRCPNHSVNFITAHDGFTLNDLVTYDEKHNLANGQNNTDGSDDNLSWNCGIEGPVLDHPADPEIEALRIRQIKNFLTVLLVSEGQPMLLMGDEVRRTQQGNNNAYCQDNQLTWFDWDAVARQADVHRFARGLIHFHQASSFFLDTRFWGEPGAAKITWHGVRLHEPEFNADSHAVAFELLHPETGEHLHVILNSYWEPLVFELPPTATGERWHRLVDTALDAPDDFSDSLAPLSADTSEYDVAARACVVLTSRKV